MKKLLAWIKTNFQFVIIVVLVLFIFVNPAKPTPLLQNSFGVNESYHGLGMMRSLPTADYSTKQSVNMEIGQDQRMTVDNNYLSLKVENVNKSVGDIKQKTLELKGFIVNMNVSKPAEATTANLSIRVPKESANELQAYIKGLGVKVVTENMSSKDVTDQYRDLAAELDLYTRNKARFEEIMSKAVIIQDILQVQNELLNIQRQIDGVKGQKQYLEQTTNSVKFTVYLSTDEYSLPYAPDTSWRPSAIFKEAVRSLVITFRGIGDKVIWLTVYSVIWAPILLIILYIKRRNKGKR